jgi:hypothetical protein
MVESISGFNGIAGRKRAEFLVITRSSIPALGICRRD